MKKLMFLITITGTLWLAACANKESGINTEASNPAAQDDSSTTNPMNSEYGTPNASQEMVDSTQNTNENNTPE